MIRTSVSVCAVSALLFVMPAFAGTGKATAAPPPPAKAKKAPPETAKPEPVPEPTPVAAPTPAPTPTPAPAPAPATTTTTTTTTAADATVNDAQPEALDGSNVALRGAATLQNGRALRAELNAGTSPTLTGGRFGVEASFVMARGEKLDLGVDLQVPLSALGLSPGIIARYSLANDGRLHLTAEASLNVPLSFSAGFWLGLVVRPGLVLSYQLTDKSEVFTAVLLDYQQLLFSNPRVFRTGSVALGGVLRTGLSYGLNNTSAVYVAVELSGKAQPLKQLITIGSNGVAFDALVSAGFQMRLR